VLLLHRDRAEKPRAHLDDLLSLADFIFTNESFPFTLAGRPAPSLEPGLEEAASSVDEALGRAASVAQLGRALRASTREDEGLDHDNEDHGNYGGGGGGEARLGAAMVWADAAAAALTGAAVADHRGGGDKPLTSSGERAHLGGPRHGSARRMSLQEAASSFGRPPPSARRPSAFEQGLAASVEAVEADRLARGVQGSEEAARTRIVAEAQVVEGPWLVAARLSATERRGGADTLWRGRFMNDVLSEQPETY
jgi:hypothetical protein